MSGPLRDGLYAGLRVLDLSHGYAGPYCSRLLADMGADVIKIEPPRGDLGRAFPYLLPTGESGFFLQANAGKRSVVLDLKHARAVGIALRLAAVSDVVLENYRPGVVARLGVGYEQLRAVNPRVIMVSISAYGQTGPYAYRQGAEHTAQAYGGVMDMTGEPDGPPTYVGTAISDLITGTHALAAIGAALYHRDRTGSGERVDVALLDCVLESHYMTFQQYFWSRGKVKLTRTGTSSPSLAPLGIYRGRDGYITAAAVDLPRFRKLCQVMGRLDLLEDPRSSTPEARRANHRFLHETIEAWVAGFDSVNEPLRLLDEAGLGCARVYDVEQMVNDPHLQARGMFASVDLPGIGEVRTLNTPLKFSSTPTRVFGPAPRLGEHTDEVLREVLGLSETELVALRAEGITAPATTAGVRG